MPAFRSGTAYTVKGWRLVTQSCSLLSVAHTVTHQGWNTCHDQHAASGSQNKLLTCGITALTQVMLPQWARVGWGTMSSKVTRHAGKPKSPRRPCEEFRWIHETLRKNPVLVPAFVESNVGREALSLVLILAFIQNHLRINIFTTSPWHLRPFCVQDVWSNSVTAWKKCPASQTCYSALGFHPSLSTCSSVKH